MGAGCVVALVLMVMLQGPAFGQGLQSLNEKISALETQIRTLSGRYDKERAANQERLRKMDAAPAGNVSEDEWKQVYGAAEKLDQWKIQLSHLQEHRDGLCDRWRSVYGETVDGLLHVAAGEKDRGRKKEIARQLQRLQDSNSRICLRADAAAAPGHWRTLEIRSYDGPQEIRQKIQLLKDLSREMGINIARLDSRYQEVVRERMTRERVQEFLQEGTLFNENIPVRTESGRPPDTYQDPDGTVAPAYASSGDGMVHGEQQTSGAGLAVNPGTWHGESPDQIEADYRRRRGELVGEQEQLMLKIREFEQKEQKLIP